MTKEQLHQKIKAEEKVMNNTDSVIYIPKEYNGDYTNNDDTLHLETHSRPEHSTTYYYKYKIFSLLNFTLQKKYRVIYRTK